MLCTEKILLFKCKVRSNKNLGFLDLSDVPQFFSNTFMSEQIKIYEPEHHRVGPALLV